MKDSGITDLATLLAALQPTLTLGEYVFISRSRASYGDASELHPIASIIEAEGLSLIVPKVHADELGQAYNGVFRQITLQVHSGLEAVGLTAAVSQSLSQHKISANVVAGLYHDHIFVPSGRAQDAMAALLALVSSAKNG